MDKLIRECKISNSQCDINGNIRVISIFHLLQDMADTHAEKLNVGYTFCKEHNLAWVGRAYHLKINYLPKVFDELILETWPCARTPIIAVREFLIKDKTGKILIAASSQWAMIDTIKLRPIKFDSFNLTYDVLPERAIDTNGHVNNCIYPMWAMETFTPQFKKDYSLNEMEINFKKPVFIEDNTVTAKVQNNSETDFTISMGTPEKEAALVKILFHKISINV
ncbi:acyl-[acyl-carrier-protein] thioesterase [Candidatus Ruminimicrobium bovinum]|uniref:acyl-[acyl-carrier-protein] thioesterase n=1 Tax=Candidatus Ruminimicrobium bovinum TaxID=3242779 RepID=UPI0039B8F527